MDESTGGEAANGAVADGPETDDDTTSVEMPAVLLEEEVQAVDAISPFDPLLTLQIGLGVLLLLLAGLTFYARRQR
jgi:hypothetical protein